MGVVVSDLFADPSNSLNVSKAFGVRSSTFIDAQDNSARMELLKERFQKNMSALSSELDESGSGTTPVRGRHRWGALRKSINVGAIGPGRGGVRSQHNMDRASTAGLAAVAAVEQERTLDEILLDLKNEDAELMQLWADENIPPAPQMVDTSDEKVGYVPGPPPEVKNYMTRFQNVADAQGVEISRVPEEVVERHEEDMERFVRKEQMEELGRMKRIEADLLWRENEARRRVLVAEEKAKEDIRNFRMQNIDQSAARERNLYRQFRRAKQDLEEGLSDQKAVLRERYGEVTSSIEGDDSMMRSYEATLLNVPQPVEMRVHSLRAVKTKLPKGDYCLMVSVFDQLGGRPLRFEKVPRLGTDDCPSVTSPHSHQGRYYDRNFSFEESIYTTCPPRADRRPSHVYIFELFQLTNDVDGHGDGRVGKDDVADDRVVAWSALPICDEHMGCVEGKLKLPFMRGEHSPLVSTFKDMEIAMAGDLNTWLANLYVEIRMLSRDQVCCCVL
jgi:hypothetical protein